MIALASLSAVPSIFMEGNRLVLIARFSFVSVNKTPQILKDRSVLNVGAKEALQV